MSLADIWGAKEDQWTDLDQMRSDIRVAALTVHGRIVTLQDEFPTLTPVQIRDSMKLGFGTYRAVCNLTLDWWETRPCNRQRLFDARLFCEATSEQAHARICSMIVEELDELDDGLTWNEYPSPEEEEEDNAAG